MKDHLERPHGKADKYLKELLKESEDSAALGKEAAPKESSNYWNEKFEKDNKGIITGKIFELQNQLQTEK